MQVTVPCPFFFARFAQAFRWSVKIQVASSIKIDDHIRVSTALKLSIVMTIGIDRAPVAKEDDIIYPHLAHIASPYL